MKKIYRKKNTRIKLRKKNSIQILKQRSVQIIRKKTLIFSLLFLFYFLLKADSYTVISLHQKQNCEKHKLSLIIRTSLVPLISFSSFWQSHIGGVFLWRIISRNWIIYICVFVYCCCCCCFFLGLILKEIKLTQIKGNIILLCFYFPVH